MTGARAQVTTLAAIEAEAAASGLTVLGAFHPGPGDGAPEETCTLVLLGPDEPGFWRIFETSPEYRDGRADPLDRWSARVIGAMAEGLGARAVFPFGGPPHAPFIAWAMRSGQAFPSPVGPLVHATRGLQVSFRGALALEARLARPAASRAPCTDCAAPCVTACPAGALTQAGYDTARCHAYLDTAPGAACRERGCAVRRACPVGGGRRDAAQAAFHMAAFHQRWKRCGG